LTTTFLIAFDAPIWNVMSSRLPSSSPPILAAPLRCWNGLVSA
jgi:hypothetical protein